MTNLEIIRAWKDEDYWLSLSDEQRTMLPKHPVGTIELAAEHMAEVYSPNFSLEYTEGCQAVIYAE